MRLVGAGEQAKRFAALRGLGEQPVDVFHVWIFSTAKILKRKNGARIDVRLARLRDPIPLRPQMMHDAFHVRIRPRVVRPRSALDRVQPRVNIMTSG